MPVSSAKLRQKPDSCGLGGKQADIFKAFKNGVKNRDNWKDVSETSYNIFFQIHILTTAYSNKYQNPVKQA